MAAGIRPLALPRVPAVSARMRAARPRQRRRHRRGHRPEQDAGRGARVRRGVLATRPDAHPRLGAHAGADRTGRGAHCPPRGDGAGAAVESVALCGPVERAGAAAQHPRPALHRGRGPLPDRHGGPAGVRSLGGVEDGDSAQLALSVRLVDQVALGY
eukprot:ctg_564.g326